MRHTNAVSLQTSFLVSSKMLKPSEKSQKTPIHWKLLWCQPQWTRGNFPNIFEIVQFYMWLDDNIRLMFVMLQVNLFQKHLFLHQLTYKITKDYSLNYMFSTWKLHARTMLRTCCVHKLFWLSKQKPVCVHNMFCKCSGHVLRLWVSCTELIIPWTICCHMYWGLVDVKIRASGKNLSVI